MSLDDRNLTLLSSFGKLTWDILGFCYEMLNSLDTLDDLVLGRGMLQCFRLILKMGKDMRMPWFLGLTEESVILF